MADVNFTKKTWADGSSGGTPITAAELNRMEQGIKDCADAANDLGDSISTLNGIAVKRYGDASFAQVGSLSASDQLINILVESGTGSYSLLVTMNGMALWDNENNRQLKFKSW